MDAPAPAPRLWTRDFTAFWSAQTVSQVGTQVTALALPLVAILLLDANAFEVGLLTTFEYLPFLLIGLPAGVWIDRLPRRPIMWRTDLGRAVLLLTVPIAHYADVLTIAQLSAVALLVGMQTVLFDVAYQSYLPTVVVRDRLVAGNGALEASRSTSQILGAGGAGALVGLVGPAGALFVDVGSFVVSALFLGRIRAAETPPERGERGLATLRTEIAEGLRYVRRHRLIGPITVCTGISNLSGGLAAAVLLLFFTRVLDLSPGLIGLAFAVGGLGAVVGAVVASRLAERFGAGRTLIGCLLVYLVGGVLYVVTPASIALPLVIVATFCEGFGAVSYNVIQVSMRQAITPDRLLGRMNATVRFVVFGVLPIGSLVGGTLGVLIGLRPTLAVVAVISATSLLPILLSDVRRLRVAPSALEESTS